MRTIGLNTASIVAINLAAVACWTAPSVEYGDVELLRDAWGTAHVYSETDAGAMYGLGYACAEDRGFQIHYFLRIMQGRLAEVLGETSQVKKGDTKTALENDELFRAFGFARAAERVVENLDVETRAMLEAYCHGVNDYFTENARNPHYLFEKIGLEREPWTPADCILSWWHLAQFFAKDGLRDHPALEQPPPRGFRGPQVKPDDDAAVVRREDVTDEWIDRVNTFLESKGVKPEAKSGDGEPNPKFSHAWVIGGEKTTTGAAVLISDPQTPVWNPNMLYEFHLSGATFNARGIGTPGSPLVLIGFNQSVAWGMTALGADQADLFLLETDPNRPSQYKVDGEWFEMKVWEEIICLKGGEERRVTLRETIFGPVVSDWVARRPKDREFALARVPVAETERDTIQAALPMFRAQNCEDFSAALPSWRFPTANCIFGDANGDIGYWSLGALPVRSTLAKQGGMTAQDGRTREAAWQGMIPYDLLPHVINPQRGYLVSANHRTIQSFYKVPFGNMTGAGGDTDRGLRIKERIEGHLAANERFTPDDVLAIQDDCVNVWKREIVRIGAIMLERKDERLSADAEKALHCLQEWYASGAAMETGVRGTALAEKMSVIFRGGVYDIVAKYGGGVSGLARFAKATRQRFEADRDTLVLQEEAEFADSVLANAWKRSSRDYGSDPNTWRTRAIEAQTERNIPYMASLDGFPGLDPQMDVSYPRLKTQDGGTVLSQRAQSYTQFVPLHDTDASLAILPPGPSENPDSPFRFSTYADWARGELHPAPLSRTAVERIMVRYRNLSEPPRKRAKPKRELRPNRQSKSERKPLPGKKPDDPILENAIRFLNKKDRMPEEVVAKISQLREYVANDSALKRELILGLELFTHLMSESQAGRLPIVYGTPETLRLVKRFYKELMDDR